MLWLFLNENKLSRVRIPTIRKMDFVFITGFMLKYLFKSNFKFSLRHRSETYLVNLI